MKCTDNKRRRRRRLSKRERRRRAIIRLMKRIFAFLCLIVIILIVSKIFGKDAHHAADFEKDNYNKSYHKEELFASSLCIVSSTETKDLDNLSALKAFGLFDINNIDARYAFQVHDKIYPASTTKILTALVALENGSLSDTVKVSKNACSTTFAWDEQTCGIKEGDTISLESLLYGLLLYSGNDTAVAIAEHIGGSTDAFAEMMNKKASELLATNSHFTNPSGLYDEEHYTTAYDLYLIFNECIKHEEFVKIINSSSYTAEIVRSDSSQITLKWEPTNYYALGTAKSPENVTIVGGKTGTLKVAGNCLILMAEDSSNRPYISVVMGADTKEYLYQDMTTLLAEIPKNQ